MKRYCYILPAATLSLLFLGATAQQTYMYTANLSTFEGTWEYRNGTEVFTLVLKVGYRSLTNHFYGDYLIGDYSHTKNGKTASYTGQIPDHINDSNFNIPGCPGFMGDNGCERPNCVTPNEVTFFFWDRGYGNRDLNGILTLLTTTTARFEVWEQEGYVGIPTGTITVPNNVVLTKVVETPPNQPNPPVEPGKPVGWIDFGV